jgi:TonB-dependent starch-binding outer membrane protein SusC
MKKTTYLFWSVRPDVNFRRFLSVKILTLLLLSVLAFTAGTSTASAADMQQLTISGTVTDTETGAPMPGVNVLIKGTTIGAITDIDGKYSFPVTDRNATLSFSFIGYVTQEVAMAGQSVVNVASMRLLLWDTAHRNARTL